MLSALRGVLKAACLGLMTADDYSPAADSEYGKEANVNSEKTSSPLWHEETIDRNAEYILLTYGEAVADKDF